MRVPASAWRRLLKTHFEVAENTMVYGYYEMHAESLPRCLSTCTSTCFASQMIIFSGPTNVYRCVTHTTGRPIYTIVTRLSHKQCCLFQSSKQRFCCIIMTRCCHHAVTCRNITCRIRLETDESQNAVFERASLTSPSRRL
jgi:hypothetical protein